MQVKTLRNSAKFIFALFFSLIRCGHHSRTLLSILDSREMFASATAALRTQPCLFLYEGARTDYTVKYTIKYMVAVKQLPTSFAQNRPSLSFSSSSRSKLNASLPTYLPVATSCHEILSGTDNTAVYGVLSDYFGGGDL